MFNPKMNSTDYDDDEHLREAEDNFSILMGVLHILTIFVTTLGNILVITVIIKSHKLHTITSGFLLNLAISDLAAGLFLVPFAASTSLNLEWLYTRASCTFLGFLYTVLCFVSTWTLASISVERFIAVNNPLKYHQMINKRRVIIVIVLIWTCAMINASFAFAEQEAYVYLPQYTFCLLNYRDRIATAIIIPIIAIFIPFCLMCYTYMSIGRIACSHAKRKVVECNKDHCMFVAPKTKDYRAARILAVMAGVFLVCWIPFTILSLWQASTEVNFPFFLTATSIWLTFLSSAINPWLYSILNRAFRQAMKSQGVRLLQKLHILKTDDDMDILENTSRGPSNVHATNQRASALGKKTLTMRESQKRSSNNNAEVDKDKDVAEGECSANQHEMLVESMPGRLIAS
ncbi:histamine H2 receptor-like [Asterias amurensis]|uniref:histamine H2 receptor-like n=1 Tax=Asterias amurensis TaxID=7602 RepID=UPI003AB5A624